jgi:hypothetical protein
MGATPSTVRQITVEDHGQASYESDMPMKHLNKIMNAAKDSDLEGLQQGLASFTLSWPFDGDATEAADWGELKRSEFNALSKAILEDLGNLGNE